MSQPFKTYKIKDFDILFFKTQPSFGNPDNYTILVYDDGVEITTRCDGVGCDDYDDYLYKLPFKLLRPKA